MATKLYAEQKTPVSTLCQMLGISRPTFYRYVRPTPRPATPDAEPQP